MTPVTEWEHTKRKVSLDQWLITEQAALSGRGSPDPGASNDILIRRSAAMADAADHSWNYRNVFTGGAIGLGRFELSCL